jgi:hypothetical protein
MSAKAGQRTSNLPRHFQSACIDPAVVLTNDMKVVAPVADLESGLEWGSALVQV